MIIDLSHLGREIHRRYDEYGIIQVFDDGNKRYLSFGTADEQSCQLKARPNQPQHDYLRGMLAVLSQVSADVPIERIAIIGTGGGGIARALFEHTHSTQIDAVDLRAAVIQVALQYFELPRNPRLKTHINSAEHFLAKQVLSQQVLKEAEKYDLIFSDIYLADGLSAEQLQSDFISNSKMLLKDSGWLVLNLWKEHRAEALFIQTLKQHFSTIATSTTKDGNWLIWASPKANALLDKVDCRQRSKILSEGLGFNLWAHAKGFYRR